MQNKDIKPINDKGQAHGCWETYWNDGTLWYKCFYVNDVIYGYVNWNMFGYNEAYQSTGELIHKIYYAK